MYIWRYILQNYNYKQHFQTSLYITFRMYPKSQFARHYDELLVAAEGLPKLPKHYDAVHMHTYVLVCLWALCGEYMFGLLLILMSKSWVCPPGQGMPFLQSDTCAEEGRVYLFLPGFSSLYEAIHGWMTGWMDGRVTWCHP